MEIDAGVSTLTVQWDAPAVSDTASSYTVKIYHDTDSSTFNNAAAGTWASIPWNNQPATPGLVLGDNSDPENPQPGYKYTLPTPTGLTPGEQLVQWVQRPGCMLLHRVAAGGCMLLHATRQELDCPPCMPCHSCCPSGCSSGTQPVCSSLRGTHSAGLVLCAQDTTGQWLRQSTPPHPAAPPTAATTVPPWETLALSPSTAWSECHAVGSARGCLLVQSRERLCSQLLLCRTAALCPAFEARD